MVLQGLTLIPLKAIDKPNLRYVQFSPEEEKKDSWSLE